MTTTESNPTDGTVTGEAPKPTGPLSKIDYSERIPNNVNLAEDRRLQRALEGWQPKFLDWWRTLGPSLPTKDVYLRTDSHWNYRGCLIAYGRICAALGVTPCGSRSAGGGS